MRQKTSHQDCTCYYRQSGTKYVLINAGVGAALRTGVTRTIPRLYSQNQILARQNLI